jgi:anti-anti-sigma factor
MEPFAAVIRSDDGVTTVALRGELDLATIPMLQRSLAEAAPSWSKEIVVDLSEVTFIGLRGARALDTSIHQLEHDGHAVSVTHVRSNVRRMLDLLRPVLQVRLSARSD